MSHLNVYKNKYYLCGSQWLPEEEKQSYEDSAQRAAVEDAAVYASQQAAKSASEASRRARMKSDLAAKSATEAVAVADLDKEFGPNMQAYKTVHDLTTSRTLARLDSLLARLDSLISAVRNSSLSDPFSKLVSPEFRPESTPVDDDSDSDEDFTALISQADQSLMP